MRLTTAYTVRLIYIWKWFQRASWMEEHVSPEPIFLRKVKVTNKHAQVTEVLYLVVLQNEFYDLYEIIMPTILVSTRPRIRISYLHAVFIICRIQDRFHADVRII